MCSVFFIHVVTDADGFRAVLRTSAAELNDKYRDVQSQLAAEIASQLADRSLLAELRPKVEQLTSLNHNLTAALAVAQLQTAVGVDDLLSQATLFMLFIFC